MDNWRQEYEAICEVIDQTPEPKGKKKALKREVLNTIKRVGFLDYKLFPPSFRWNLCAARMRLGRFDNYDGWSFRSDWAITFMGFNGYPMKVPKWTGGPVEKLVLLGEQGVGDEILFASAVPDLLCNIGHCVEFQCTPRLKDFFSRAFRIKCVDRQKLGEIEEGPVVALADLFMFYRRDKAHFPKKAYAKLDPDRVQYWRERLPKGYNIGIAWRARHGMIDPRDLMFEDANYINLQYLQAQKDGGDWIESLPPGVINMGCDPLVDLYDHMHLIKALDKVVTVTQTVTHECGAVGTECHVIRPKRGTGEVHNSLWFYGLGNTEMWPWPHRVYNSVKDYARLNSRARQVA